MLPYLLRGMIVRALQSMWRSSFSLLILCGAGGAIGTVAWLLCKRFLREEDIPYVEFKGQQVIQYWGQLGDFFGGVLNPILSFLAILAVLYTIRLQSKELREAREETKIANKTLAKQTQVFERQNFDSVFFRMLEVHARLLADVDRLVEGHKDKRGLFGLICSDFKDACGTVVLDEKKLRAAANACMEFKDRALGHYFRNMYQICKMIDDTKFHGISNEGDGRITPRARRRAARINYERKRFYANILRGQLSSLEMQVLFLNCLTPQGLGLKYYVEKFSMLKPLSKKAFLGSNDHLCSLFEDIAYMDSEEIDTDIIVKYDKEKNHENTRRMLRL
ncbi:hypothetical protein DK184_22045 [Pseudomonas sp. RW405]|nr:putative phage abortive infection protein [Pseudomonas sp. CM25]PWY47193.1 hypothetical protein DK184_22045 [Pseudomonas sp. RW405]